MVVVQQLWRYSLGYSSLSVIGEPTTGITVKCAEGKQDVTDATIGVARVCGPPSVMLFFVRRVGAPTRNLAVRTCAMSSPGGRITHACAPPTNVVNALRRPVHGPRCSP